jgi:hypothetical protein
MLTASSVSCTVFSNHFYFNTSPLGTPQETGCERFYDTLYVRDCLDGQTDTSPTPA